MQSWGKFQQQTSVKQKENHIISSESTFTVNFLQISNFNFLLMKMNV